MNIVISQSMYFPWVGLLEQVNLADVFVHYDDVQYAKGFYNRVQIKIPSGVRWISVPLKKFKRGQLINEIELDESKPWRENHREILRQAYINAPYLDDMLNIVDKVFNKKINNLADVSRASIIALSDYFDLSNSTTFVDSKELNILGKSSQRLCDIVLKLNGTDYITGHGAKNYLDHAIFEDNGISVQYMNYQCIPYKQLYGEFTPYVSSLDLVANCGKEGKQVIRSTSLDWKEFLMESK